VGVIVTALFVMRNRFSTWRLDRSKSSPGDAEEGTKPELETQSPAEAKTEEKEQASAASDAPLINKDASDQVAAETAPVVEESTTVVVVVEQVESVTPAGKEVVTSSSSLIVNVLNELSESVACKLESVDPEKEPLQAEAKSE